MIKVNSKIKLNMPKINQLTKAAATALEMTAEHIHSEVVQAQVMPRDTGAMQNEKTNIKAGETVVAQYENGDTATNTITEEQGGKVSIITASPQVRRLYFHPEYHFQTHENPNAKGEWYEDWLPGGKHQDEAKRVFTKFYKGLTGL